MHLVSIRTFSWICHIIMWRLDCAYAMKLYAQSKIYKDHSIILNVPDEMYCVIRLISLYLPSFWLQLNSKRPSQQRQLNMAVFRSLASLDSLLEIGLALNEYMCICLPHLGPKIDARAMSSVMQTSCHHRFVGWPSEVNTITKYQRQSTAMLGSN